MKLGTHNTFTYLPVRQWYLKPFAFTGKCQEVDIWQQYSLGARLFDLRVKFNKYQQPILCHGILQYEHDIDFIDNILLKLNKCKGIYVRVILETFRKRGTQQELFSTYCKYLEKTFENIKFFGGNRKSDWKRIYYFNNCDEDLDGKYSSVTSLFNSNNNLLRVLDDLYPKYYAKKMNKTNIVAGTTHKWLFIDFINIK